MGDKDGPEIFPASYKNSGIPSSPKYDINTIDERARRNVETDAAVKAVVRARNASKKKKRHILGIRLSDDQKTVLTAIALASTLIALAVIAWNVSIERIDARYGPPPNEPGITQQYDGGNSIGK